MMDKEEQNVIPEYRRRCPAMMVEGITDPESQEGINFCVEQCPYPDMCIAMEGNLKHLVYGERIRIAKGLRKRRVEVSDIALILDVSERAVRRYLKK